MIGQELYIRKNIKNKTKITKSTKEVNLKYHG